MRVNVCFCVWIFVAYRCVCALIHRLMDWGFAEFAEEVKGMRFLGFSLCARTDSVKVRFPRE